MEISRFPRLFADGLPGLKTSKSDNISAFHKRVQSSVCSVKKLQIKKFRAGAKMVNQFV